MEPNDLKSTPPDDAALETWLRANTALPPLPDAGFSSGVLAALPPPSRSHSIFSPRLRVCLAGAVVGSLVTVWPLFSAGDLRDSLPALDAALVGFFDRFADPTIGLALAVTVGSLCYIFWRDLRRFVRM